MNGRKLLNLQDLMSLIVGNEAQRGLNDTTSWKWTNNDRFSVKSLLEKLKEVTKPLLSKEIIKFIWLCVAPPKAQRNLSLVCLCKVKNGCSIILPWYYRPYSNPILFLQARDRKHRSSTIQLHDFLVLLDEYLGLVRYSGCITK